MSGTHLAVDFGARFADFVAWDEGSLRICKVPNRGDVTQVTRAGLAELGLTGAELDSLRFVTTAPLNALLDRAPGEVALLTTRGFADTLRLGRQNRVALYDPVAASPAPAFLVPEAWIHEIGGRLDASGAEVEALSQADLDRAIDALRREGVKAVAVCFLFSHLNPAHEEQAAEALRAALPEVAISLSHVIDPAPREYDRTVSAALDAWIAARAGDTLAQLRGALPEGFAGQILLGEGRGVLVPEEVFDRQRAVLLTGAPAAAARAGARASVGPEAPEDTLVLDIGSQSADIALVQGGEPVSVDFSRFAGVDLRATMVDMASVALGGARGVRQNGAELTFDGSAPEAPCLDDALAVLGRLPDPGDAARACISGFVPGKAVEETARQIVRAAAKTAALALIRYATRRNVDPARAGLCVMGGTGPLLAAEIAAEMDATSVSIPRAPAVAGAMGLAQAPRRREAIRRADSALADLGDATLTGLLEALEAEVTGEGTPVWTLTLAARAPMHPLQLTTRTRPASVAAIREDLARAYDTQFAVAPPGPGHLFSIRLSRDTVTTLPAMPGAGAPTPDATRLVTTEAGAIYLPDGWDITQNGAAYRLTRSAP